MKKLCSDFCMLKRLKFGCLSKADIIVDNTEHVSRNLLGRSVRAAAVATVFLSLVVTSVAVDYESARAENGPWGGFSNGEIPLDELTVIDYPGVEPTGPSLNPMRLKPDAAVAFYALLDAYHSETGDYLHVDEGYRDLATQWYWWNHSAPGNASYPGTSNHGWGAAVDFYQNDVSYGNDKWSWLANNAATFGFTPLASEAWHWNYSGDYVPPTPPAPIPPNTSAPVAINLSGDVIGLYEVRPDKTVWGNNQTTSGGTFSGWVQIGGGNPQASGRPTVVQTPSGLIAVYVRSDDGQIYGTSQSEVGQEFGDWAPMGLDGNGLASDPRAVVATDGRIALFASTIDGRVAMTQQVEVGGAFPTWSQVGPPSTIGELSGRPAVVKRSDGSLALFVRTADGHMANSVQSTDSTGFGAWSITGEMGGGISGEPAALVLPDDSMAVYAVTAEGNVSGANQSAKDGEFGTWATVSDSRGDIQGVPSVALAPNGTIVIYATTTGSTVIGAGQPDVGGAIQGWQTIGVGGNGVASEPTAFVAGNKTLVLYARTVDGKTSGVGQIGVGGAFGNWEIV